MSKAVSELQIVSQDFWERDHRLNREESLYVERNGLSWIFVLIFSRYGSGEFRLGLIQFGAERGAVVAWSSLSKI